MEILSDGGKTRCSGRHAADASILSSPPNLTFPLRSLYLCSHYIVLFVLSTNGSVHLLCNVVQLFNLCKSGLIYGAAVRKETSWRKTAL